MIIRRFLPQDAGAVSHLVVETLHTVNAPDYTLAYRNRIAALHTPEEILKKAAATHFYVACEGQQILGCGSIGPAHEAPQDSCLYTVFVHAAHQREGIGRRIMAALEQDALFTTARRVLVPASITGAPFYLRLGYTYCEGVTAPDEDGLLLMEKVPSEAQRGGEE